MVHLVYYYRIRKGKKTAHESEKSYAKKTKTGLEYTITYKADNSKKVNDSKIVMTHYAVYFEDGSLLDTSILEIAEQYQTVNIVKKNQGGYSPIAAKIGPEDSMISGFKEGLKLLNVGDKLTLFWFKKGCVPEISILSGPKALNLNPKWTKGASSNFPEVVI